MTASELTNEVADTICLGLTAAPTGQMEPILRERVVEYLATPRTLRDKWDLFVLIASGSCCLTSSFIKALCSVDRFYKAPAGAPSETVKDFARSIQHGH